jgi:hypothetical protein
MNESKYTMAKKGARFAVVTVAALLLALAALAAEQALSAKPAEAGPCVTGCVVGGGGTTEPPVIVPPNDNFSAATKIEWLKNVSSYMLSTKLATLEPGEPKTHLLNTNDCADYGINNSVWFTITPKYNGNVTFSAGPESNFDTVLRLFQGSSLTSLRLHSCRNSNHVRDPIEVAYGGSGVSETLTTSVNAGETYYLQVSGATAYPWGRLQFSTRWGCYYPSPDQRLCPIS